jgi:uracil-DNA glycosylase
METILDYSKSEELIGWKDVFDNSIDELEQISNIIESIILEKGDLIYPRKQDIFNAFKLTNLNDVKVVIVGQDPYHTFNNKSNLPTAMGLSFSVRDDEKIPPSLINIFKEIKNNYPDTFTIPKTGNLEPWTKSGVLLLNSCLTVEHSTPGAHSGVFTLWTPFIKNVLKSINDVNPKCIFLLWGKDSQKLKKYIGEQSIILEAAHPSPFSVNKGFFGCNHFKQVNDLLEKQKKTTIDWNL